MNQPNINQPPAMPPSDSPDVAQFYYTHKRLLHPKYRIGKHTYGVPRVMFNNGVYDLTIGDFSSFGPFVEIYMGGEHPTDWTSTYPFSALKTEFPAAQSSKPEYLRKNSKGAVTIGNDVWIAGNVKILSGVTIGDGAVIGASSVVTRDIPPYAVAAGNPARVIRYRFDEDTIAALLRIQWWHWPVEKIKQYADLLVSPPDVEMLEKIAKEI